MVRVQEGRRPRARRRFLLPVGRVPGAWSGCSAGWLHGGAHLLPRVYFRRQRFFFRPRGYEAAWRCQEGGGVGPPSFTRSPAGSPLFNLPLLWGLKGKVEPFPFFFLPLLGEEQWDRRTPIPLFFCFTFLFLFFLCCLAHLSQTLARWCPKRVPLWFIPQGCVSAGLLLAARPRE